MKNTSCIIALLFFCVGCGTSIKQSTTSIPSEKLSRSLIYNSETEFSKSMYLPDYVTNDVLNSSEICESPIYPEFSIWIDKDQKYGCFCGLGYPKSSLFPNENLGTMSPAQRKQLVLELYEKQPLDQIDAACLRHDVCVTLAGKQTISCNRAFIDDMFKLKKWFYKDKEKVSERCFILSSDSGVAFLTPIPEARSDKKYDEYVEKLSRLISFGAVGWAYIVGRTMSVFTNDYPLQGEKCFTFKSVTEGENGSSTKANSVDP